MKKRAPKTRSLRFPKAYYQSVFRSVAIMTLIIVFSLLIGVFGYHYWAKLSWVDALLNASMILTGMGPVSPMENDTAKLFASFYALFSGVVFLSSIAVFISPLVHQFMYKLHMEKESEKDA
jgi:uncharacterized protein involved in cysteine biosynthesis